MSETVQLLENTNVLGINRGTRRLRTICLITLLLLPSIYLLTESPQQNHIHPIMETTLPDITQEDEVAMPAGYLVWNPVCQIPDIDPFDKSSMKIFKYKKYVPCSDHRITYILNDDKGNGVLHVNNSALTKPLVKNEYLSCCYSNITRPKNPKDADAKVVTSKCIYFNSSIQLLDTEEFVVTKCIVKNRKYSKKIYEDAHSNVQIMNDIKKRYEALSPNLTENPWSVLIIGIDTLSRINLARAMPKTHKFLVKNSWLDFQGYNKIDDNTYPNLMAFLTGRNQSRARSKCDGKGERSPDNCDFIWKRYQKVGYVTAYGEDYVGIDTFGKPLHKGFNDPPTDHYVRRLFMAAEKMNRLTDNSRQHCTGRTTSGEALFGYALDFVKKYEKYPFFAFFWANTFSHDDVTSPSRMDVKISEFFDKLKTLNAMNRTIVLFISDHGIRFGKLRASLTGYYEERLPSLYMWLPPQFKRLHPVEYNNMNANTKKLTSPYDVYLMFEDILFMSQKYGDMPGKSEACPTCLSLFLPLNWNRSCEEAGISSHWCTCHSLMPLPMDHSIARRAIDFILDVVIENAVNTVNTKECRICAKLNLDNIISVNLYNHSVKHDYNDYLLMFETTPGDMAFESTVRHFVKTDQFEEQGIVSRLTAYAGKGNCVKTAYLKKYCHCTNKCKKTKS